MDVVAEKIKEIEDIQAQRDLLSKQRDEYMAQKVAKFIAKKFHKNKFGIYLDNKGLKCLRYFYDVEDQMSSWLFYHEDLVTTDIFKQLFKEGFCQLCGIDVEQCLLIDREMYYGWEIILSPKKQHYKN